MLLILLFGILSVLFWMGFKITGAVFTVLFWLFVKVPLGLTLAVLGLVLCVTILLIPLGIGCLKLAFKLIIPG